MKGLPQEPAHTTGHTFFVNGGLTLYVDLRLMWSSE